MTPQIRRRREPFKRELTELPGLPTPDQSMSIPSGMLTPKQEDPDSKHLSDRVEGGLSLLESNADLHKVIDLDHEEGDTTEFSERKHKYRSPSPSLGSFPDSFRQPTMSRAAVTPSMVQSIAHNIGGSLQIVGEKVKLLVDAIEDLRKLGLKEIDTELPELVLVGDQSAGKSSLMGAIAEINLPKKTGMCTRCPANIKTSSSNDDSWSCVVSLNESYYHSPDHRRSMVPTKNQPFPPWRENMDNNLTIRPFKTIFNKDELEDVVMWAQIALLNPSQDYRSFVPGAGTIAQHGLEEGHKNEADFSPNVVAIEISGPGLPALSFYDLPGIFAIAPNDEEEYLIKAFENLATKYIKKQNALIICAIPMSSDPGTSRTSAIIGQCKARPRTIGVLTMPDRLQDGKTHRDFDLMLQGKIHVFPRGYFVTKQPGETFKLRGSDFHQQAREEEELFFDTNSVWTDDWHMYRHRCGTRAIQSFLSQEFARLIANSMPNIDSKIKARAAQVDESLCRLPELPGHNVQHVVGKCLQDFSNAVKDFLQGGPHSNDFLSAWGQLSVDFAYAIQEMKPKFIFTDPSDGPRTRVINLDGSDDESVLTTNSPSTARKRSTPFPSTPNAKRQMFSSKDSGSPYHRGFMPASANGSQNGLKEEDRAGPAGPMSTQSKLDRRRRTKARETPFDEYLSAGSHFMSIADIRDVISKYKRPGHPDNVTDAAREDICLQCIRSWDGPVQKLADRAFAILRTAMMEALNKTVGIFRNTDLFRESKRQIRSWLQMHQNEQMTFLNSFWDLENYKLFTLNEDAFGMYKAEELKLLQARRREHRIQCYITKHENMEGKGLPGTKRSDLQRSLKDEQLGPDPFAREIDTAAYVRGYYKTAGFRFADNLCQNIQGMLFRKVHTEITFLLEGLLEINQGDSEARCHALLNEDHGEARRRAQLQDEKMKLAKAASHLEELVQRFGITPDKPANADDDDMDDDELTNVAGRYSPARLESADEDERFDY